MAILANFKDLELRNLQYEIIICQNEHTKVTMTTVFPHIVAAATILF